MPCANNQLSPTDNLSGCYGLSLLLKPVSASLLQAECFPAKSRWKGRPSNGQDNEGTHAARQDMRPAAGDEGDQHNQNERDRDQYRYPEAS